MGRKSDYTVALGNEIAAMIAEGKSLRTICSKDEMPSIVTIYNWLQSNEDFLKQYTRAKEEQADSFAEDILEISDNATPLDIQVAKLRVDSRKWLASKFKAKKYGDSTQLKHADADGNKLEISGIYDAIIKSSKSGLPEEKA